MIVWTEQMPHRRHYDWRLIRRLKHSASQHTVHLVAMMVPRGMRESVWLESQQSARALLHAVRRSKHGQRWLGSRFYHTVVKAALICRRVRITPGKTIQWNYVEQEIKPVCRFAFDPLIHLWSTAARLWLETTSRHLEHSHHPNVDMWREKL